MGQVTHSLIPAFLPPQLSDTSITWAAPSEYSNEVYLISIDVYVFYFTAVFFYMYFQVIFLFICVVFV